MATIRKHGARWQVQIRRKGFSSISKSFVSFEDATKWSRDQERQIDRGEWTVPETSTFLLSKILTRYENEVSPRKRSRSDPFHLRQISRHSIANISVGNLTPESVGRFRDDRLKQVGPGTVRKELTLLGHVLKHANLEWGVAIKQNPVTLIRKPSEPHGRRRRLEANELAALERAFKNARNPVVREAFLFALATGMRRGEVLSLTRKNVHLEAGLVELPMTKNGEDRVVPLSPEAMKILAKRLAVGDEETVFPITPNALRMAWERLVLAP